jgi:hypothetical protein
LRLGMFIGFKKTKDTRFGLSEIDKRQRTRVFRFIGKRILD